MKNKILWFFVTNYGRYALGILLALTGIFSQYSTIDFLRTDLKLFEYSSSAGVILIVFQFIFHAIGAIIMNTKNK